MKTDAEKTVQSLKKINEFPFYTAKYYGDYKIDEFRNGAIKNPNDVVPFFQSMFMELGKPAKLSFPEPPDANLGCSAFFYHDENNSVYVGKNNDWKRDPVLLLKTEPENGLASLSMVNLNFCDLFRLNSFEHNLLLAPYVPQDGMNEKGLVVTMLSVNDGVEYPVRQNKPSVGDFNIIRIILDTCSNVDEAVSLFKQYNIMQTVFLPIHYLIADKNNSSVVEFFDEKMHVNRKQDVNYLTNILKLKSSGYINQKCDRYTVLEKELEKSDGNSNIGENEVKELLKRVSVYTEDFQVPSTIWSLIYSLQYLRIKIKVGDDPKYYSISLKKNK
jgi:hypothetical protein